MFQRLIKNDLAYNKVTVSVIAIFLLLSMTFSLTATRLTTGLTSSISHFLQVSKSPHLLQMHKGEIDRKRLADFVKKQTAISHYQIVDFVNIENADIKVNGQKKLQDSVQDNGFSSQNRAFDLLLNEHNQPAQVQKGEIYIPLFYYSNHIIRLGDDISIKGLTFKVKGFVRDPQMNAGLVSSKRFLLHPADLEKLKTLPAASLEYLIEFQVKKLTQTKAVEQAYIKAGLESNGPPMISFATIQIINGINDALLILVLVGLCLALIFITFLCMHFALLTKIEEDLQQIAIMKVMGLPYSFIKKIYLAKYYFLCLASIILAWGLSFLISQPLSQNIFLSTGVSQIPLYSSFLEIGLASLLCLIVVWLAGRPLKVFKKMTPAQVLTLAKAGQARKKKSKNYLSLPKNPYLDQIFFSLKMIFSHKKMYLTMFLIVSLTGFLVLLPANLAHTLGHKSFVQHLGVGQAHIRLDISQTSQIEQKAQELVQKLEGDERVDKISSSSSKNILAQDSKGKEEKLRVSLGDHSTFPIKYIEGQAPVQAKQIALSRLNAEDLKVKVGDQLSLKIDGQLKKLTLVGVYSDLTYGGKTAKATFKTKEAESLNSVITLTVKSATYKKQILKELKKTYPNYRITDIDGFIEQTLGSTITTIQNIQQGLFWVGILILFILMTLFVYMIMTKDRTDIALLRMLGFPQARIKSHYLLALGLIILLALGCSFLALISLGQGLCNLLFSGFGLSQLELLLNPSQTFLMIPLALLASGLLAAYFSLSLIQKLEIPRYLKE
ncbi:ABC transporter permease [Streptococcus oricebi]|uniref:ABC transporter permease n=1 Tax=Streptococcus oricebi TaxID=1547447 RepID=A0ABS5B1S9_9STRE|nr:ABC transporter permease [Streptococcus oricebi]MBP2622762.1 ABC transporter permease [Streptococcus oricebi]